MKHEIKKLNQLKHSDSFMQINYLRGFKYVDKAGEIVNSFFTGRVEPPYQMTGRELIIKESDTDTKTYRIAVNNVWGHYSSPDNLGNIETDFLKKESGILKILGVDEIVRIGWRNYFVYELQNVEEKNNILSKLSPIDDSEFLSIVFQIDVGELKCKFFIKGAEKRDEKKTPAIIFDIDCSMSFDIEPCSIADISGHIKKIRECLYSGDILHVINLVLSPKDKDKLI